MLSYRQEDETRRLQVSAKLYLKITNLWGRTNDNEDGNNVDGGGVRHHQKKAVPLYLGTLIVT